MNMDTLTVSFFRTNMAETFNRVDGGQRVLIRRKNRYYAIMPVIIDNVLEDEPNELTTAAILEAKVLANNASGQSADVQTVDTSSVEAMLKSCGV